MLESILWILLVGYLAGQAARRLGLPALVGMALAGILLGPQVANRLSAGVLDAADGLRTIAVIVILMKAGLGLDRSKLAQQGTVALRLGFLPAACEAVAVMLVSMALFGFSPTTGLLLGCVLGAESPAVIVPGMLRLKQLGWGVKKGIPDAILTGSALSDVLLLLVFSLLLAFLTASSVTGLTLPGGIVLSPVQLLPFQVVMQIGLGVVLGWVTAKGLWLLSRQGWTSNTVQDSLMAAGLALLLVVVAQQLPIFSGYLAVMATGFFLIEFDPPLARRLRGGFNSLWTVAEIVLFVLLGASIQLSVLESTLWSGLLVLAVGTFVGRSLGWYLSTLGSNWTNRERLFLLPGNSAKATVQAAIGAIPLAQGIEGGEIILALAALSILVTAPLGAWAIPAFAPKLLTRGTVDPTKVTVETQVTMLAVVDPMAGSSPVLMTVAAWARRCDGRVIVLLLQPHPPHPQAQPPPMLDSPMQQHIQVALLDIQHQVTTIADTTVEGILAQVRSHAISEVVIQRPTIMPQPNDLIPTLVAQSPVPVILV